VHDSDRVRSYRFRKSDRLLASSEFARIFNGADFKASHPQFLLLAKTNEHGHARLGLVIGKKHVRLAVGRNRLKRLIRESFRLKQLHLPAIDAIVLARRGADEITNQDIFNILEKLWMRVAKKATQNSNPSSGSNASP